MAFLSERRVLYARGMSERRRGLYEVLITEDLEQELSALDPALHAQRQSPESEEIADRIALHLARVVERELYSVPAKERVAVSVKVARALLDTLRDHRPRKPQDDPRPVQPGELLRAIQQLRPDGSLEDIASPLTPLLDTTLLTNAPGEPRVGQQVLSEIDSADRIDLVMAFIRRSGLMPFEAALRKHCGAQPGTLRVLTTTYTQSTELSALTMLRDIGADVRVSYDTSGTRLHAKAWLFHRDSGYSTAFIGSSNLTHSAQVTGLEWNVRASGARNAAVVEKVSAVFDSYWHAGDFLPLDDVQFREHARAAQQSGPKIYLSPVELRPEPFQERMLEQLSVARARGQHRNLIVSATGTGKTVMAAVDYARLREHLPRARLLFVAHRKEILEQSLATFRHALRKASFGELWVDGQRPEDFEHVFASIQSLHASGYASLARDHFDVVVIDEFHHAAAKSYQGLLAHLAPRELLALTATPERSDQLDVLSHFGGRITAELRLWDAIDQHRLAPFVYYGVHDGLDLRKVPWRRGHGYDVESLGNVMTGNDVWARHVLQSLHEHLDDASSFRALGFCVNVDHARYMARFFSEHGIESRAVWGESTAQAREDALEALREGSVRVVFSVDLFNEGVDLPDVDTLLLLRPTESATLFLQQLGRGLRRSRNKAVCTVLDFVGIHRAEFRFDLKLRALLGGTRRELETQVAQGFPYLPAGCHMQLDRVSRDVVLESLRRAVPSNWADKVRELRALAQQTRPALLDYLRETGLDLDDVYSGAKSWSDLCADAGLAVLPSGPHEVPLRRAVGRLLHVDDTARIEAYTRLLTAKRCPAWSKLNGRDRRYARMLAAQLGDQVFQKDQPSSEAFPTLFEHPQVLTETAELMALLSEQVDHVQAPLDTHPDVPLVVHARYTRIEILAAFGVGDSAKVAAWQTGVRHLPEQRADLLAFTLDKTGAGFSPTTRYRDYAISRDLIHWESQGVVRADGETGRRYQTHVRDGHSMLLFARLHANDRAFWFLGPATYVDHRGEQPMAITWRLAHSLPGDLFTQFAAAVA